MDDYNSYFLNQLYELLTECGPISVAWFDGANPDPSVEQAYDCAAWYDLIRRLQPRAVISVKARHPLGGQRGRPRTHHRVERHSPVADPRALHLA